VQLLEELSRTHVLFHFNQVLAHRCDGLRLVLLPLLLDPPVQLKQVRLCSLEVILPHEVVRPLDMDVNAGGIHLFALLHCLYALPLSLFLV